MKMIFLCIEENVGSKIYTEPYRGKQINKSLTCNKDIYDLKATNDCNNSGVFVVMTTHYTINII